MSRPNNSPAARRLRRLSTNGALTGMVGAVVEAWAQLRIGKMRVLLSLVGVAVAVAAMTFIIAFGQISSQAQQQLMEQWSGRPGTVNITVTPTDDSANGDGSASGDSPYFSPATGQSANMSSSDMATKVIEAQKDFVGRYKITQWATSYPTGLRLDLAGDPRSVDATIVSPTYGMLHRTYVVQGRWFTKDDADDLSPSIVVSQSVLQALGMDQLTSPIKVRGYKPFHATYTIVGVLPKSSNMNCWGDSGECSEPLTAYVLDSAFQQLQPPTAQRPIPTLEVWAGEGKATEMKSLATQYFNGKFGAKSTSIVDNEENNMEQFDKIFTMVVSGAGLFTMILGALGLINISLVTVRQRIHEIGVRRSFGATSRRVFFSIMMESVVATVVAGVVGIIIAIIATRFVPWDAVTGTHLTSIPPFPMSAAIIGLLAASGVGALAGIIPAIVAVRIRPIDAIRI